MFFLVLFYFLLGCVVSWLVIMGLLNTGIYQRDAAPQAHHTHAGTVPPIGGVGLMAALTVIFLLCVFFFEPPVDGGPTLGIAVFLGAAAAFLLGLIDDFKPLGAKMKLLAQIIIALLAYYGGLAIDEVVVPFTANSMELGIFGMGATVFWFVAMMNLINLIDGLDGLAGGVGLMLMILLAYLGIEGGAPFSYVVALVMTGAIVGFLFHNFPPAKVYMGDSGAYMLGFLIAALSLINSEKGSIAAALIAPVMALALPISDVLFAMIRRGLRGLPLFRPDQEHIHHQLLRSGFSRRNTVLLLYGISLLALVGGLVTFVAQGRNLPIFLGFAFVVVLFSMRGRKIASINGVRAYFTESMRSRHDARNALQLRNWLILEAERADSGQNLWSDFRFVLKKMGFCRAELHVGDETRSFYVPNTPHETPDELWQKRFEFSCDRNISLTLYAEKDHLTEQQFFLIAELAAEACLKAMCAWKQINGSDFSFTAEADDRGHNTSKKRRLYRPAY
ncbi:MAG: MraY family glycosyltransferase [Opitutales bacterium]